jgi:hypothetical protein
MKITLACLWLPLLAASLLTACSPTLDWREVRAADASFSALFPAKPASVTRPVNLNGTPLSMTMTGADVDGVTYAVGSAVLPQGETSAALHLMKQALVRNIAGTLSLEKQLTPQHGASAAIEIEAFGTSGTRPLQLSARFVAKDRRIFQVLVVGPKQAVTRDAVVTFLSSFKPN